MKILHNLHVQSFGCHDFILILNSASDNESLIFCGTMSHVFGEKGRIGRDGRGVWDVNNTMKFFISKVEVMYLFMFVDAYVD